MISPHRGTWGKTHRSAPMNVLSRPHLDQDRAQVIGCDLAVPHGQSRELVPCSTDFRGWL